MSEACSRCEGTGTITIRDEYDSAVIWCGDCLGSGKSHPSERAPEVEWGAEAPAETPKP